MMPGETFDNHLAGEKPHSIESTFSPDDRDEPTTSIIAAVADATNQAALDLAPLAESVDPDTLDQLFAERASDNSSDLRVTFPYAGSTVTVSGTGDIRVTPK